MARSALIALALLSACSRKTAPQPMASAPPPQSIADACAALGTPHIEEPRPGVLVAIGYSLSNTILIHTPEGNVVIDAMTSPTAAAVARRDLLARAPGKTLALIYTHSHLDHVGGASVWTDASTPIWASANFKEHFFKQYGFFQPTETTRGGRQYGLHVAADVLPCTSIGPLPDLKSMLKSGARLPTRTFTGTQMLELGGVRIELIEAHGETHDEIMIWIPGMKTLLAGDTIYKAFPNLYTIRGTTPRPVDAWIESLDAMRRLEPNVVIPSHTAPIIGAAEVQATLTTYRDAIQWVRDATVRGANAGLSADTLAESIKLPEHLAKQPFLAESYGQVDWSVRAIYADNLGWFSGEPERLYPLGKSDAARREIALMGGGEAVLTAATTALAGGELKWAVHLLAKLRDSGLATGSLSDRMLAALSKALHAEALTTANTNGRGYLAESALELVGRQEPLGRPEPDVSFVQSLPLDVFLSRLGSRLKSSESLTVHQSIRLAFPDTGDVYTVTIRYGVVEVAKGKPLPGTPAPIATARLDSLAWKLLALKLVSLPSVLADGKISVEGSWLDFARFMSHFQVE